MTSFISVSDASYSIANKHIFNKVSLNVNKGDRICLVGRNGAGKTTLMRIINQEIEIDSGNVVINPKKTIGYLPQKFHISGGTIYEYLIEILGISEEDFFSNKQYLADILLDKLQLDGNILLKELSGGQLRRATLAGSLIIEPDLLLLDEPTNHLDITSIEWLEEYLQNYHGAIIIISHDRTFLKKTTNKTFWLDRGNILTHGKGFEFFEAFQEEIFQQEEKNLQKMSKELVKQESWLTYGVTARRKRNQHRLASLIQLRDTLKNNKSIFSSNSKNITLESNKQSSHAKVVLEIDEMGFEYTVDDSKKLIFKPFSLRVLKNEIIGIVGKNGSGKTTFLKLITEQLQPSHGSIKLGANINVSYFDQNKSALDQNSTVQEVLCPDGSDMVNVNDEIKHVKAYLKDFMFDKDTVNNPVSNLSGGEQSRLLLAKILSNPGSLLILDEPTNDLDIETLDMLEEMLGNFKGTVIMVSHDRDFLDKLATRTLVFDNNANVECVVGGYEQYKELLKENNKKNSKSNKTSSGKNNKKTTNISYNVKREYEILPQEIEALSKKINDLQSKFADPALFATNPNLFNDYAKEIPKQQKILEELELKWLSIAEQIESSSE
jgi:ABC transport system ATP-binding/permease protein